jgi:hypothetical protein
MLIVVGSVNGEKVLGSPARCPRGANSVLPVKAGKGAKSRPKITEETHKPLNETENQE